MAELKKKLHQKAKDRLLQLLSQDIGQDEIVDRIKDEFGKTISLQAVSYYNVKYQDKIDQMRIEFYQNEVFRQPIAHKGYRLRELQKQYRIACMEGKVKSAIAALRAACSEMGENFAKLADALSKSGGDNIVNIGITGDADRLIEESASILGLERTEDRM